MSNPALTKLAGEIVTRSRITDPEQIALVSRTTIDYAALSARAMSGEDVSEEIAIAEATAMNLDRATRKNIGDALVTFLNNAAHGVLVNLLAPGGA